MSRYTKVFCIVILLSVVMFIPLQSLFGSFYVDGAVFLEGILIFIGLFIILQLSYVIELLKKKGS